MSWHLWEKLTQLQQRGVRNLGEWSPLESSIFQGVLPFQQVVHLQPRSLMERCQIAWKNTNSFEGTEFPLVWTHSNYKLHSPLKLAYIMNGLQVRALPPSLYLFFKTSEPAAFSTCKDLNLDLHTQSKQDRVTFYCEAISCFLKAYKCDDVTTGKDETNMRLCPSCVSLPLITSRHYGKWHYNARKGIKSMHLKTFSVKE